MLFWRLELLVYAGEPITDYGVQVAAAIPQLPVSRCVACAVVVQVMCPPGALAACIHVRAGPGFELGAMEVSCSSSKQQRGQQDGGKVFMRRRAPRLSSWLKRSRA